MKRIMVTITSARYFASRCTLNQGGGFYRCELSCGHNMMRNASKMRKRVACKECAKNQTTIVDDPNGTRAFDHAATFRVRGENP